MKRIWFFIVACWITLTNKLRTKKQKEEAAFKDACLFGAEIDRLYRQCDIGEVGVDFEHGLFQMSTKEYENHICRGPFTEPIDMKAHLYFGNIRTWMNIHREKLGLPPLDKEDPIIWGVANEHGELYITGSETRTRFDYSPYTSNQETK